MKKLVTVLGLAALVMTGCKEEKNDTNLGSDETKEEVKVGVHEETVNYDSFGVREPNIPKGLKEGDKAPDIMLTMQDGSRISLEGLYKDQPLVLFFYRGEWCPICIKHLSKFAEEAKKIEERGVKLVAITSESYDNVNKTKEKTKANFTIVSDTDGSIMEAFDVDFDVTENYQKRIQNELGTSIAKSNASGEAVLPVPATYIINTNGDVIYVQFNPDYKDRATVQDIIDHLPAK